VISAFVIYIHQTTTQQLRMTLLILVMVIMNCGDKSINPPKLKRQTQNMCCYLY